MILLPYSGAAKNLLSKYIDIKFISYFLKKNDVPVTSIQSTVSRPKPQLPDYDLDLLISVLLLNRAVRYKYLVFVTFNL